MNKLGGKMKKIKKAAALKYDTSYTAPVVTAAGMGHIADKIIECANEASVPLVVNSELANLLNNIDIGQEIPEELYDVVAKIIAFVMDIDNKAAKR